MRHSTFLFRGCAKPYPSTAASAMAEPSWLEPPTITDGIFEFKAGHSFLKGLPCPREVGHPAHRTRIVRRRTFNPGVVRWRGRTLIACRSGHGNMSGIWIGYLDAHFRPIRTSFVEILPYYTGESFEDPRLFVHRDRLFLSCAVARPGGTNQCLVEVGRNLRAKRFRELRSPTGKKIEKNWIFFGHGGIHCIYHAGHGRHEIYRLRHGGMIPAWSTRAPIVWPWGEIRGGTNVVWADDRYWVFFHSQYQYPGLSRYFMGAYAFEARPPFRILAYTPAPLYTPSEPSLSLQPHDMKCVIFPGGLLRDGADWIVFSGYNDERVVVSRTSHAQLTKLMVTV